MRRPGTRQSSLIAAVAAAALLWLWYGNNGGTPPDEADDPDAIAEDEPPPESWSRSLRTTQYTPRGDVDYVLEASEQIQENENLIRVINPVLRLFDDSTRRWQVTAVSGTIHGGGSREADRQLDLDGDVRVDYTDDGGHSLVMTTARMTVYPDDEVLYSNVAVQMLGAGFEQSSSGMRAALQEEQLTFFGRVQGRFHDE
ncbi:MAG: LPS export ABC transporter periplasmic protein LptC [Pseudohongiellaceae bacterium]